jgi:hypothetical protein
MLQQHRLMQKEAGSKGGEYVFTNEYADAWEAFMDNPTGSTVRSLLKVLPPSIVPAFLDLCQSCCPEGKVDPVLDPFWKLGIGIINAAYSTMQNLAPVFGFATKGTPSSNQLTMFYEFVYFFAHMMLRTASHRGFNQQQFQKLKDFLGPLLASAAVDSYCGHWPDEFRKGLWNEFYQNLNAAERDYSECQGLVSQEFPLDRDTLFGRLAANVAELWSRSYDDIAKVQVAKAALDAFKAMQLERLVSDVAAVIDQLDGDDIDAMVKSCWK